MLLEIDFAIHSLCCVLPFVSVGQLTAATDGLETRHSLQHKGGVLLSCRISYRDFRSHHEYCHEASPETLNYHSIHPYGKRSSSRLKSLRRAVARALGSREKARIQPDVSNEPKSPRPGLVPKNLYLDELDQLKDDLSRLTPYLEVEAPRRDKSSLHIGNP